MRNIYILLLSFVLSSHLLASDQVLYGFGLGSGRINDFKKAIHARLSYTQIYPSGWAGEGEASLTSAESSVSNSNSLIALSFNTSVLKYFKPYANVLPYAGFQLGLNFMSDPFDKLMIGHGLKTGVVIRGFEPYLLKVELKQSFINNTSLDPLLFTMTLEKPLKTRFFKTERFLKRRVRKQDA